VTLSLVSSYSELGGHDSDLSSWRALVGGRQLEWPGTLHLCQHGARDLLPVAVPWHGYRGWPIRVCKLVDPLGAEAIRRLGVLSGWHGTYVLGKFSR
jgi:hypothetical protein